MQASLLLSLSSWLHSSRHLQLVATFGLATVFAVAAPRFDSRVAGDARAVPALAVEAFAPLELGSVPAPHAFSGEAHATPAGPAYEAGTVTEALAEPAR